MAVVAVGDFDKAAVEKLIKAHFASIPAATDAAAAADLRRAGSSRHGLRDHDRQGNDDDERRGRSTSCRRASREPSACIGSRSSTGCSPACSPRGSRRWRRSPMRRSSAAGAGRGLFLRARRSRLRSARGSRRTASSAGWKRCSPRPNASRASASPPRSWSGRSRRAARLRAGRRRKGEHRRPAAGPTSTSETSSQNETLPSADDEYALHQRFLPEITLDEVNKLAKEWFPDRNRLVIVTAPEKTGLVIPDEAKLAAVIKAASSEGADSRTWIRSARRRCSNRCPRPGTIAKTTTKDAARHHRVGAVQRREGRAQADDVQGGRDSVSRHQSRRHVARERQGLHPGQHGDAGHHRRRPGQVQRHRSAEDADGKSRVGEPVHRRARGGAERQQLAQGSGDDVPAHLSQVHAAATPTRRRSACRRRR